MTNDKGRLRFLLTCSTLEVVALAIWVGGLVVIIAAVIPAVFNSFGMEPGGRFLTRVFNGYNRLIAVASAILVSGVAWRVWVGGLQGTARGDGWAGTVTRVELALLATMLAVAAVIGFGLGPHSVGLQEQAFAAQGEATKKAAYDAFFRTHTVVRGLYVLNLSLGVALLTVKLKGWMRYQMESRG